MTAKKIRAKCARLWEVEAAADGRLRGYDVESLRRHVQICSECEGEQTRFTDFRKELQRLPPPRINEISARRIRQQVLTVHNGWLMHRGEAAKKWPGSGAILLAAACVLVSVFAVWRLIDHRRDAGMDIDAGPTIDVSAGVGARWRREGTQHDVRIVVDEGQLHLRIHRQRSTDRVSIGIPDGEIEDLGTVLEVSVARDQTQAVAVLEGRVVLRLHGSDSQIVAAGETWHREAISAPAGATGKPRGTASAKAEGVASPTQRPPAFQARERHSSARTTRRQEAANGSDLLAPSAGEALPNPADVVAERAEDDAYLHIIDLVRNGDAERARVAAREYLLRFPNGFRRIEVLNIATRGGR